MTDQTPESGAEGASAGLPTPTFESPSPDSSTSGFDAKALAKEVAELLMPEIDRKIQSTKDKRIAQLEKQYGSLSELEELGVSIPENVKQEYRLRQIESKLQAPVQASSQGRGENPDGAQALAVLNELELDTRSPEVAALMGGKFKDITHFTAEAAKLKVRQLKAPNPTPAQAPAAQGQTPHSPDEEAERKALIAKVQVWQRNPSAHKQELGEAYKKLGW